MNLWVRLGVISAGEKRLDYCNGWNCIAAAKGSIREGDRLVGLWDGLKEGGWFSNISKKNCNVYRENWFEHLVGILQKSSIIYYSFNNKM